MEDRATRIVSHMYDHDAFSQWMGMERVRVEPGLCILKMEVRPEMTNGFGIAHGSITYALADSALAFAANGHGTQSVSVETSLSHIKPCKPGDTLTAEAREDNLGNNLARYTVRITNQHEILVALFRGTVYRTDRTWELTQ